MKKSNLPIIIFSFLFLLIGCNKSKNNTDGEVESVIPTQENKVKTMRLTESDFKYDLISNGKLSSAKTAKLYFQSAEPIAHIWVKNGDIVKKGDKIAQLDLFKLANKVEQTKGELDRSLLELKDVLIGQGYRYEDSLNIPKEIFALAKVKSGFDLSRSNSDLANYELKEATLRAPFDGVIANISDKPYGISSTTEPFCLVIDNHSFQVNFTVLENELPLVNKGNKVTVTPFAMPNKVSEGVITEINPVVDENGMVKVSASVSGSDLCEGMNVRVSVQQSMGKQLVIPKEAVVLRSGRQVVFTLSDGKAYWNYVTTGFENASQYSVTEGLKAGDVVIVSGNINLAHESPVTVIE